MSNNHATCSNLREGLSTGTTATGAALASLHLLLTGMALDTVLVPLPPFEQTKSHFPKARTWRPMNIAQTGYGPAPGVCGQTQNAAHAGVVKDGGDDPDVTNGAIIYATIFGMKSMSCWLLPWHDDFVTISGGPGIGKVTRPGLPIPVGEPAINPVPRQQIRLAIGSMFLSLAKDALYAPPYTLVLSVPNGEKIAEKTLNPRLGIIGGISIIGTQGTVRPYSHAAWTESLKREIAVAMASGSDAICMSTGRRSEKYLQLLYPDLPSPCFIQVADNAEFALKFCASAGFKHLIWGCFFGKLLKLAQGLKYTHASAGSPDFALLERICEKHGIFCRSFMEKANTASSCLEMLLADKNGHAVIMDVMKLARKQATIFANAPVRIHLFHINGRELARL